MRIALDGMGGDYAPGAVVEGLAIALTDLPKYDYLLVGHETKLKFYLEKYGLTGHPRVRIVHAPTVCEMSDPSTSSLRAKKDCSITVCAKLVKSGEADAMVTPGHTGATVAATKVLLRTLPGVDRAALAASLPSRASRFLLIDAGANPDSTAVNLCQYAVMGNILGQSVFKMERPRIGLLSVGGEDIKGNTLTKETFKIMSKLPFNFVGNVEADSAFEGAADVVICDGFVGNVMLKGAEGLAKSTIYWLRQVLSKNALRLVGAMLAKNAFRELKAYGDAADVGGAPLLGVNGICIIGHGSSSPKAVRNAIRVAGECVEFGLNQQIVDRIREADPIIEEVRQTLENK